MGIQIVLGFPENDHEMSQLLQRAVAGDDEALSKAWDRHSRRLRQLVKIRMDRRLAGRIDPSDVLQEAFCDYSRRIAEYLEDPPMPFFLWLRFLTGQRLGMMHRQHLGVQKRDARREISLNKGGVPQATSVSLAAQLLGKMTSVTKAVQRAELQLLMQDAVNEMAPLDREIIALRHFEELSNAETAEVLNMTSSAVSTRHVRALKKLRERLKGTQGLFPLE